MIAEMKREEIVKLRQQELPQLLDLKKSDRESISEDVERFLKSGGEIKIMPIKVFTVADLKTNFNETLKQKRQPGLGKCLVNPRQNTGKGANNMENQKSRNILRRKQVEVKTGLSRSSIYARMRSNRPNEYDPTFPKPIQIGKKAVGWIETEIDEWLSAQAAKRV